MILHSIPELQEIIKKHKAEWKKIVWTNGCFDIIHPWHMESLKNAKSKWDIVVIWLNGDQSPYWTTKPWRPINNEDFRAKMLDAIRYVDYIIIFQEENPYDVISAIIPDVLVKWWDYKDITTIAWHDVVLKNWWSIFIDEDKKYNTSDIIKKIQSLPSL